MRVCVVPLHICHMLSDNEDLISFLGCLLLVYFYVLRRRWRHHPSITYTLSCWTVQAHGPTTRAAVTRNTWGNISVVVRETLDGGIWLSFSTCAHLEFVLRGDGAWEPMWRLPAMVPIAFMASSQQRVHLPIDDASFSATAVAAPSIIVPPVRPLVCPFVIPSTEQPRDRRLRRTAYMFISHYRYHFGCVFFMFIFSLHLSR